MDQRAIGVFDSGLGGLTAVRQLRRLMPSENIIYFGDTARVPYGNRSRETLLQYAWQDLRFLSGFQLKAVVVACGTVSTNCLEELRREEQEELIALFLDTRNRLLKESLIFRGTVNASPASPREIFVEALSVHAVRLVLVHNHPSGDPAPSREDLQMTERIRSAGELLGIRLLDHIIIGDNRYSSLRERGILPARTDT